MSEFIELFLSLIKKGDEVLDLGAGDGKYSVLIAKKVFIFWQLIKRRLSKIFSGLLGKQCL